ncbi:MAG: aspartyl-phosphate phosphatase Spo0E family protein [Clostridia bacterium]|nr:aspartyl-phosphate phosphatase Spo0E family protein [Clostridia bacterium]
MLNEEICKLRKELNDSISNGKDYSIVYELSVRLDKLIAEFYKKKQLI